MQDNCVIRLEDVAGDRLVQLPYVLRILLENVLRNRGNGEEARSILDWLDHRKSQKEIPFQPSRLMMHDTTCGPALADIAGMRQSLFEAGFDPSLLNPGIPIDVSVDHSIAVDHFGVPGAVLANMKREQERNEERFKFMKWAQANLSNVRIHPPGTGIMHTINLEQLASVVTVHEGWAFPDTLIGTDSHTPMINGLGVLAWGVGGLEAEGVMFGVPVMMRIPDVVGVRLEGALQEGVLATDLALHVTHALRSKGYDNPFVEFFGPGVTSLTVGQRAVVANMAPEMGGQTAYFPVDEQALIYLAATNRTAEHVNLVRDYTRSNSLWFDPDTDPRYTDVVNIDLASVKISLAGPQRPQDLIEPQNAKSAIEPLLARRTGQRTKQGVIEDGAVAIAAITSCTNTSDARLNIAAGLMARRAHAAGLKPKPWVKTSLSPGSPAAASYLERAGLIDDLEALGFGIVGFGCMTCIGNSGPLLESMDVAMANDGVFPVAILSGNRNFPGRVHPQLSAGFLASPPMVIAYALAGSINVDIQNDPLGQSADGTDIFLRDIWPKSQEIEEVYQQAARTEDFPTAFEAASKSALWQEVQTVSGELWPFDPHSTYLRRPPFADFAISQDLGRISARVLLVLGDDITTDQISPAGPIPPDSEAGRYLIARGENPRDLNVYSSRRGNFEVMHRGLFTNHTVENHLGTAVPPGHGIHFQTGERLPLYQLGDHYRQSGVDGIIFAGERYGAGSSRDWAAKGTALIGARAVVARSFERIHRTNLIGMGILPLKAPSDVVPAELGIEPTSEVVLELVDTALGKKSAYRVEISHPNRPPTVFEAVAQVETDLEVNLLLKGGIIPFILDNACSDASTPRMDSRSTVVGQSGKPARVAT